MAVMREDEHPRVDHDNIRARFGIAQDGGATPGQLELQRDLRQVYAGLAVTINESITDSRAKSLALTALEESLIWVGKALFAERTEEQLMADQNRVPAGSVVTGIVPPDKDIISMVGEGVHTGLRKGTDKPSADPMWHTIAASNDGAWGEAISWFLWGLRHSGWQIVKVTE